MTYSMKIALDLLKEKNSEIDLNDLGFVLTVLRDNALDDEVHLFLEMMLFELRSRY